MHHKSYQPVYGRGPYMDLSIHDYIDISTLLFTEISFLTSE